MSIRKIALIALALVTVSPVAFARDDDHGRGRDDRYEDRRSGNGSDVTINFRFGDTDRRAVRDYYEPQFHGGNCPPGLAKKHNGCQPPGQARKWQVGQPLPGGVAYYPLPPELLGRLPPAPAGHEYVRVANDVLMIAAGSAMVIDAITDIGR